MAKGFPEPVTQWFKDGQVRISVLCLSGCSIVMSRPCRMIVSVLLLCMQQLMNEQEDNIESLAF